ncbi:MAG: cyclic nucleotide-binding domain-containing protein [Rhodocyclaceae bacterium]
MTANHLLRYPQFAHLGRATRFVDRILAILDHIALFEDFDRDDIGKLAAYMPCYSVPAGVQLIREGDEGDFLVLLLSGSVGIVKRDRSGQDKAVATVGVGKTLGEMSMIDGKPRAASCIALTDTMFALLDRDSLSRILTEEPELGIKFLIELVQLLAQRLRQTTGQLADQLADPIDV